MPRPLDELRVLDLTSGPAGGFATQVLADFGAEVVKIEPPGGDRFRSLPGAPLWLRGKQSVVLDLRGVAGREQLRPLVAAADVVVVSGPPGREVRLGVDFASLTGASPELVHCSITPFGPRGPYAALPGYEGVVAAKSGRMRVFEGQLARPGPAFSAVPVATHATAQGAVQGILAGLFARERGGGAQRVETSLLQGLIPYELVHMLRVQLEERSGKVPDPNEMGGGMPTLNYHPVMAGDGRWIQLGNLLEHLFLSFLDAADLLDELLAEERFQSPPATWDTEAVEAARDRILLRMRERPAEEWMARFRANGNVAAEVYASAQEALDHPDLVANGEVGEHVHPRLGVIRQIGPIARLVETPGRLSGPAPEPGADTERVLASPWPVREARARKSSAGPSDPALPLSGVTVLEFAAIIAAPLGVSLLADLGARVIKVEPLGGDPYRTLLPGGAMAVKTNAGKQSICLDAKTPEGREIVRELVRRADVLVHNYRPGVPERLGIGYAEVRALRPDCVWVSLNGYGPDGPGASRPSAHPVPGAAMGGATYQAGAGRPDPRCESLAEIRETARLLMRANEPNPDPNTSVVLASATLLALLARERFGIGQQVFVNMLVANAYANGDDFLDYRDKPPRPELDADLYGLGPAYRLYATRSEFVFVAATTPAERAALSTLLDGVDLDDAVAMQDRLLERAADEWEKLARETRVPLVRADGPAPGRFFAGDPHVAENGFAPSCEHLRFGPMRRWGPLVTLAGGAERYAPGALAGEHTDAILEELGYTRAAIAELRARGRVASEPV